MNVFMYIYINGKILIETQVYIYIFIPHHIVIVVYIERKRKYIEIQKNSVHDL